MLLQIIYVSSMIRIYEKEEIIDLCKKFSENNIQYDITGVLFYNDGNIIQYLEGPSDNMNQLFANICEDSRHKGIITLVQNNIKERNFKEWSMKLIDSDFVDVIKMICSLVNEI